MHWDQYPPPFWIHFRLPLPPFALFALYWATQVFMRALPADRLENWDDTAVGNTTFPDVTGALLDAIGAFVPATDESGGFALPVVTGAVVVGAVAAVAGAAVVAGAASAVSLPQLAALKAL